MSEKKLVQKTLFGTNVVQSSPKRARYDPVLESRKRNGENIKGFNGEGEKAASVEKAANVGEPRRNCEESERGSASILDENFNPAKQEREDWMMPSGANQSDYVFSALAKAWREVELLKNTGTGSKKKASAILGNIYRSIMYHAPSNIIFAVYLSLQRLGPAYFGIETGVGENALVKTVCETYGRSELQVKNDLRESGDLGEIAYRSKVSMSTLLPPPRLSIEAAYKAMLKIAAVTGSSSQALKRQLLRKLLVQAVDEEAMYIIRFLEKQLRIGVKSATIINALCRAFLLTPPMRDADRLETQEFKQCEQDLISKGITDATLAYMKQFAFKSDARRSVLTNTTEFEDQVSKLEQCVRGCYSKVPNLGLIVMYLLHGLTQEEMEARCQLSPGIPVSPMLAKPTKSYGAVLNAMEGKAFRAEYKYDGERVQIHKLASGEVKLFSRNLETLDAKYPDVRDTVLRCLKCESCILDSEVVAFDKDSGNIQSFQVLSGRKRKDVDAATVVIQVQLCVFDCLQYNGSSTVDCDLKERLEFLEKAFEEDPGKMVLCQGANCTDQGELEQLMAQAIESQTEGLMIKILEGPQSKYQPSQRTLNWLKLKKDYLDNLGDSLDLVPMGAFYGRGKRSGAYGSFLLGVYDADEEVYKTVCKVATGFSENDLSTIHQFFQDHLMENKPPYYNSRIAPDVWFEACQVWEVKAADLSVSPVHTAALDVKGKDRGVALRFPRFIRIRDDKRCEDATNSKQIVDLYNDQFSKGGDTDFTESMTTTYVDDDLLI